MLRFFLLEKKSTLKIHEGTRQRGTIDMKQKIYVSKLINLSQPDRDYVVFIVYVYFIWKWTKGKGV
jgi:hypothetical protein